MNSESPPPSVPVSAAPAAGHASLRDWATLVRLPTVFTLIANVLAGFLLVAGQPQPWPRLLLILIASVLMYWAGMILNDAFDYDRDFAERPHAVLPTGRISLSAAYRVGWGGLVGGVFLAGVAGHLPGENLRQGNLPLMIAIALAIAIYLYDGPLKRTPLAPAVMGICRGLSFLLAASVALPVLAPDVVAKPGVPGMGVPGVGVPEIGLPGLVQAFPRYVLAAALGFTVYITGLTAIARREADPKSVGGPHLFVGAMLVLIGVATLAFVPRTEPDPPRWFVDRMVVFPGVIAMLSFPVLRRAMSTASTPSPAKVGATVRMGILNVIPLSAGFALLASGIWGIAVFALVVPALWLSQRLRVT
ncbi:MAG: UbiA family prenyltransferase [Planctomycetota bacterium]